MHAKKRKKKQMKALIGTNLFDSYNHVLNAINQIEPAQ